MQHAGMTRSSNVCQHDLPLPQCNVSNNLECQSALGDCGWCNAGVCTNQAVRSITLPPKVMQTTSFTCSASAALCQ